MISSNDFFQLIYSKYTQVIDKKSISKEYLAMILKFIISIDKNENEGKFKVLRLEHIEVNEHQMNNIQQGIKEHEERLKSFAFKMYFFSLLSVVVAFVLLIYFRRELWILWLLLASVYLIFDILGIRKTISGKYDIYFKKLVEREVDPELLGFIKKNLEINN